MDNNEQRIFNKLNRELKHIKQKYDGAHIFGIYTYGDFSKIICVVIPTFESVCLRDPLIEHKYQIDKNTIGYVVDFRYLYRATKEGYPQIIEGLYTDYYLINPRYEHLYINLLKNHREKFKQGILEEAPPEELKIAIVKILRTVFNDNSAAVRFIKQLTDLEKTAIEQIIAAVGDEGIFSQAKIASAAGISRVAMTNLIMKMQLSGVAEIQYMGNKGTYFKIIDDTLLRIRGL
jgi:biotin operon repressor